MEKSKEQQIYEKVFAPVAMDFACWVTEEAVKRGVKRLYFLARDGYQSFLAADFMVKKRGLPLECRYLEGSRYAWRLPEYALLEEEKILDRICIGGIDVTLRKILRRGGLTEEEAEKTASSAGLKEILDRKLSYSETRQMAKRLSGNPLLISYIKEHSERAYESVIGYFRQEGLFEDINFAVADSGWTGSVQQTLSRLLDSARPGAGREVEGYYFGLYELPAEADPKKYHVFFFRPYKDTGKKSRFSNCLFEAVFSEERGQTVGYERKEGRFSPVRETEFNPNRDRIAANVSCLREQLRTWDYCGTDTKLHMKRLLRLMSHPEEDEAEIMGSYLFSDDVWGSSLQKVARDLTEAEIKTHHPLKRLMLMKGGRGVFKDSAWIEGSIVKNGRNTGRHLFNARLYKKLIYLRKKRKS